MFIIQLLFLINQFLKTIEYTFPFFIEWCDIFQSACHRWYDILKVSRYEFLFKRSNARLPNMIDPFCCTFRLNNSNFFSLSLLLFGRICSFPLFLFYWLTMKRYSAYQFLLMFWFRTRKKQISPKRYVVVVFIFPSLIWETLRLWNL